MLKLNNNTLRPGIMAGLALLTVCVMTIHAQNNAGLTPVPGSNGQWQVEQAERSGDARIAPFLGREALWLKNNTAVIRNDQDFTDGTIEFDVAPMEQGHFIAVQFRRSGFRQTENIYLRPFSSGEFDAMQYAPQINGATWQLYPEFNAQAELPRNAWTHVRLAVSGARLQVYVNNTTSPALVVPRLRSDSTTGKVSFWARVNNSPEVWAAALSNVTIRHAPATAIDKRVTPPAGFLTDWEVAELVRQPPGPVTRLPELKGWRAVPVEESGLLNLSRLFGRQTEPVTAFARTTIKATEARLLPLALGYSDQVSVFLNGELLYSGVNAWESRYPGFLGYVKPSGETLWLHLRPGNNELIMATRDDQRFGWGLVAQLATLPAPASEQ